MGLYGSKGVVTSGSILHRGPCVIKYIITTLCYPYILLSVRYAMHCMLPALVHVFWDSLCNYNKAT